MNSMVYSLLEDVRRTLSVLEHVQQQFVDLFAEKTQALRTLQPDGLVALAEREAACAQRLQAFFTLRSQLLARAAAEDCPATSFSDLAARLPTISAADRAHLLNRIRATQTVSAHLRHQGWTHWITARRCLNHYTEMLDLIAHGGQAAPTYEARATTQTATYGGAVLDASA